MAKIRPLRLEFAERAADQLQAIDDYIRPRNALGADRVGKSIYAVCEQLTRHPYLGRPILPRGMRAFSVVDYPYVVVYKVLETPQSTIMILGIFHTAQGERKV